jgi:Glutamyl-tRNAGlu reductase, N-terminal domain
VRMLALGVDHRSTPTAVREALAFEGERRQRGLDALKSDAPDAEFVLLSTCNRVELYAAAESAPPDVRALAASLARFHDVPVEMLNGHLVARRDEAAVDHLFRVAAGLESDAFAAALAGGSPSSQPTVLEFRWYILLDYRTDEKQIVQERAGRGRAPTRRTTRPINRHGQATIPSTEPMTVMCADDRPQFTTRWGEAPEPYRFTAASWSSILVAVA